MQHLIAAWTICARISKDGSGWRSNKRGKTSVISNLGYLCDVVFMCINHIWSHLEPFWQKRWVIKIWQDLRSLMSLVCFADLKASPQKKLISLWCTEIDAHLKHILLSFSPPIALGILLQLCNGTNKMSGIRVSVLIFVPTIGRSVLLPRVSADINYIRLEFEAWF